MWFYIINRYMWSCNPHMTHMTSIFYAITRVKVITWSVLNSYINIKQSVRPVWRKRDYFRVVCIHQSLLLRITIWSYGWNSRDFHTIPMRSAEATRLETSLNRDECTRCPSTLAARHTNWERSGVGRTLEIKRTTKRMRTERTRKGRTDVYAGSGEKLRSPSPAMWCIYFRACSRPIRRLRMDPRFKRLLLTLD